MNYITLVTEDGKYLILTEDTLVQARSKPEIAREADLVHVNGSFYKVNNHLLIDSSLSDWIENKTSVIKLKKITDRKLYTQSSSGISTELTPWYKIVSEFESGTPFVITEPIPKYIERKHNYLFHPSPLMDFTLVMCGIVGIVYFLK